MNIMPINQSNNNSLFINSGASRKPRNAPKGINVIMEDIPLGPEVNVSGESIFHRKVPLGPISGVSKESIFLEKIPLGPESNVNEEEFIEEMNNSVARTLEAIMANTDTI